MKYLNTNVCIEKVYLSSTRTRVVEAKIFSFKRNKKENIKNVFVQFYKKYEFDIVDFEMQKNKITITIAGDPFFRSLEDIWILKDKVWILTT